MASVIQCTLALSSRSPTSSSPLLAPSPFTPHHHLSQFSSVFLKFKSNPKRRSFVRSHGVDKVTFIEPPGNKESTADHIGSLKLKLLRTVSGLNRGLAASSDDLRKTDAVAKELEAAGGPVDLQGEAELLQGRWKLIYSSAFSSGTLGGSRPGPPIGRLVPITLGQVFQRIDVSSRDFDNIVDLELGAPWPLQPVQVTATLAHKFELIGTSKIKIAFERTTVKTVGNLSQLPPLEVPRIPDVIRPASNRGSGEFDVVYVDSDMRVTRGDRGELRVFVIS